MRVGTPILANTLTHLAGAATPVPAPTPSWWRSAWQAVRERSAPHPPWSTDSPMLGWPGSSFGPAAAEAGSGWLTWSPWIALGVGVLAAAVPPLWRVARIGVTFVHEAGHAVVGVLAGRRFTGFVVRPDMSGHAVTVGPARGPGLVATTWIGYPAPALVATGLVWVALAGWAPLALGLLALGCLVGLGFARSFTTAIVTLAIALASGAAWWWRDDARSGAVLLTVAMILLIGAWRHWGAVTPVPRGSDPAQLVRLTRWPAWFWLTTQLLVIAAATLTTVWLLWGFGR